jgi:hypothetical protein
MNECKHPRVQIVAREEDAEFVECLECGDIFESSEFKDMMIEDTRLKNESYSRSDEGNLPREVSLVRAICSLLVSAWERLPAERSCQL